MNETKDYSKANNIKFFVAGISLRKWCYEKGYSYAAAYQMLRKGTSQKQMIKRLKSTYISRDSIEKDIYSSALKFAKIYQESSRDTRLKIRAKIMNFNSILPEEKVNDIWELIVEGNIKKLEQKSINTELWKQIEKYPDYEVSNLGSFRKKLKDGTYRRIKVYVSKKANKEGKLTRKVARVSLESTNCNAAHLVALAHLNKPGDEYTIVHMKDKSDPLKINVNNLFWVTKSMHGRLTGYSYKTSIPVHLLDENNEIIETFDSVRQAGLELGLSYQTVLDICKGRISKCQFNLKYGEPHPEYIPTWGFGGGKKRIAIVEAL